jgi:hypothetical protein
MIKYDRLAFDCKLQKACLDQRLRFLPYFHKLYTHKFKATFFDWKIQFYEDMRPSLGGCVIGFSSFIVTVGTNGGGESFSKKILVM